MKKEPDHLTSLILQWQREGTGFASIIREASKFVIDYPRLNYKWDKDKCSDFYLFFYRRLITLIENFEYQGISFKALLKNTIIWQMSSFYRQNRVSDNMNHCIRYDCELQAEAACDSESPGCLELTPAARRRLKVKPNGCLMSESMKKRLLMLALKNANYLDETYIRTISELTNCSSSWLADLVWQLRIKGHQKRCRLEVYTRRANKAYLELCQLHRELGLSPGLIEHQRILDKIDTIKKRMHRARLGKNAVLTNPSNHEVAKILNMPKGSIDSGLYLLKKDLTALSESDDV